MIKLKSMEANLFGWSFNDMNNHKIEQKILLSIQLETLCIAFHQILYYMTEGEWVIYVKTLSTCCIEDTI